MYGARAGGDSYETLVDHFCGEDTCSIRLVTQHETQYMVYMTACGHDEYYGTVILFRIEGDRLVTCFVWGYDAASGAGCTEEEMGLTPRARNELIDQRARKIWREVCEDPLALSTRVLL